MSVHLHRDLEALNQRLLGVGALVETATNKALRALIDRRPSLAEEVVREDAEIDREEVLLEQECLKLLALHQPLASDLRFLIAVLKLNNDLERMGDLASNLAERAIYVATNPPLQVTLPFEEMGALVLRMQRKALDAVLQRNLDLALECLPMDDEVDALNVEMYKTLEPVMKADGSTAIRALHALSCSRYLERIADHATNIAEDVIFMINGEVVRHQAPPQA